MKVDQLKKHIKDFFCDKSRTPSKTLEGLEDARDEIDMCILALKEEGVQ